MLFTFLELLLIFGKVGVVVLMLFMIYAVLCAPNTLELIPTAAFSLVLLALAWLGLNHLSFVSDDYERGILSAGTHELIPLNSGTYCSVSGDAVFFHYKGEVSGKLGGFPAHETLLTYSLTEQAYAIKSRPFFSLSGWTYEIAVPQGTDLVCEQAETETTNTK